MVFLFYFVLGFSVVVVCLLFLERLSFEFGLAYNSLYRPSWPQFYVVLLPLSPKL